MDESNWVTWNCPECGEENMDSYKFTARPLCEGCECDFDWDDVFDTGTQPNKSLNATADAPQSAQD